MKDKSTKIIVEGGIMIALAYILSMIKLYELPNGGSITAVSMLPIAVFAIRHGVGPGLFVASTYGILQFILGPKWSFHWVSILCDYVLGFGAIGISGILGKKKLYSAIGILFGISLRFVFAVVSGVVVFASYAPVGQNPILYSAIYNGSYLIPEAILTIIAYILVYKPLSKI
jgi:thiamine transporter